MNPPAASPSRFSLGERLAFALCAGVVALAVWSAVATTPRLDWNSARLMPAFVLAAGEKIYFAPGTGPALGWIYGPVTPAIMTPIALFPTITSAMLAAACINAFVLLAPLLCGVNVASHRAGLVARERAWLLIACAGGALAVPWIAHSLIYITADNVVVGLVLWSCVCLANAGENIRHAWCAALLAALAVWTKQLAIGVPVAQIIWLAWSAGPRAAVRQAGRLLVAGLALAGVAVAIFGFEELRYNLWAVPSHHPLKGGGGFWAAQLGSLALACLPFVAVLAIFRARGTPLSRPATLLAIVGCVQLPLGALGASKVGGGENSFHTIYYFAAATGLQLAAAHGAIAQWVRQRVALVGIIASLVGAFAVMSATGWRLTPAVQLEASAALAEAHRGEIYFPRNPLVTWWTERKIYHLEYGFFDQALAGNPATPQRMAAWLPPKLRYIVYQDDDVDHPFARLLPGFERTLTVPGFTIHVAAPAAAVGANSSAPALK
jgi:hypothetical protein